MVDSQITFNKMDVGEARSVSELVRTVFDEFVAHDFSEEGIETFINFILPEAIVQRLQEGNHFIVTAKAGDRIVGVIEVRDPSHICLLFVNRAYHRRGIAKELYRRALQQKKEENPDLKEFEVNASKFAVPIYEKMGFKKMGEAQVQNGILFTPMKAQV